MSESNASDTKVCESNVGESNVSGSNMSESNMSESNVSDTRICMSGYVIKETLGVGRWWYSKVHFRGLRAGLRLREEWKRVSRVNPSISD